jgi:Ser/Thr protein kinase RdoA (MazF antagonist)
MNGLCDWRKRYDDAGTVIGGSVRFIQLQTPMSGRNDNLVHTLADGTPVTLLEWVKGKTVENIGITPEISRNSGKLMAIMHTFFSEQKSTEKRKGLPHFGQVA